MMKDPLQVVSNIKMNSIENKKSLSFNKRNEGRSLTEFIPSEILEIIQDKGQKAIPFIAKQSHLTDKLRDITHGLPTTHQFIEGDARNLATIPDKSVHLIVTSPPYWTLKKYPDHTGQMGHINDYEEFLMELDKVWQNVFRVLVPGGRLVVVVGDVCLSRRVFGRHAVYPLHSSIQEHCRAIGFDNLAPIIWYKISNAKYEAVGNNCSFLGKPYEPNGIIKNDIEYILFQRKPGGYRTPSLEARILSIIPEAEHRKFFNQIWDIKGASTRNHPAPYPLELAERLIRMFSFVGDTVLDPFSGTGTTALASALWGRNSVNIEVEPSFYKMGIERLEKNSQVKLSNVI